MYSEDSESPDLPNENLHDNLAGSRPRRHRCALADPQSVDRLLNDQGRYELCTCGKVILRDAMKKQQHLSTKGHLKIMEDQEKLMRANRIKCRCGQYYIDIFSPNHEQTKAHKRNLQRMRHMNIIIGEDEVENLYQTYLKHQNEQRIHPEIRGQEQMEEPESSSSLDAEQDVESSEEQIGHQQVEDEAIPRENLERRQFEDDEQEMRPLKKLRKMSTIPENRENQIRDLPRQNPSTQTDKTGRY